MISGVYSSNFFFKKKRMILSVCGMFEGAKALQTAVASIRTCQETEGFDIKYNSANI